MKMIDKDFEKFGEIKMETNNELPPYEMKYIGKKIVEYDQYFLDDHLIKLRESYFFDECGLYEVIYEDAYGDWSGKLMTKEEIKKQYNLTIE